MCFPVLMVCFQVGLQMFILCLCVAGNGTVKFVLMHFPLPFCLGIEFLALYKLGLYYFLYTPLSLCFTLVEAFVAFQPLLHHFPLTLLHCLHVGLFGLTDLRVKLYEKELIHFLQLLYMNFCVFLKLNVLFICFLCVLLHCLNIKSHLILQAYSSTKLGLFSLEEAFQLSVFFLELSILEQFDSDGFQCLQVWLQMIEVIWVEYFLREGFEAAFLANESDLLQDIQNRYLCHPITLLQQTFASFKFSQSYPIHQQQEILNKSLIWEQVQSMKQEICQQKGQNTHHLFRFMTIWGSIGCQLWASQLFTQFTLSIPFRLSICQGIICRNPCTCGESKDYGQVTSCLMTSVLTVTRLSSYSIR